MPTIEYQEIELKYDDSRFPMESGGGLAQPGIWIPLAAAFLRNGENLYMGYIRGDDFWHYRDRLGWVFTYLMETSQKSGSIQYPREWDTKDEVIKALKDIGLFRLCWTCELPIKEKKPCGLCVPCISMKSALWRLSEKAKLTKSVNKEFEKAAKKAAKKAKNKLESTIKKETA